MDTTSKAKEQVHDVSNAAVEQDELETRASEQGELTDEESEVAVGAGYPMYKAPLRGKPGTEYKCRKCGFHTIAPPLIQDNCPKCGEPGFNTRAYR